MSLNAAAATRAVRIGRAITILGLAMAAFLYLLALQWTPPERFQGLVQKLFYLHPPSAYAMQLAFVLTGITSALYLWLREARLDAFAEASAEVGLLFGLVAVITGPIWGRPTWGTWWEWEPRLTFTLLELLVFSGYFALRSAIREPAERAAFAAVLGITALVLVPFNHLTVYWFASQHPEPLIARPEAPEMPWVMVRTFLFGLLTTTVLYIGFVMQRYGIGVRRQLAEVGDA
jgi:heme exporter protein C